MLPVAESLDRLELLLRYPKVGRPLTPAFLLKSTPIETAVQCMQIEVLTVKAFLYTLYGLPNHLHKRDA